jgi:hypothetical protein
MVPLSHFPEAHAMIPVAKSTNTICVVEGAPLVPCQIPGGPFLINSNKFSKFWIEDFTGGSKFVGLENPFGPSLRLDTGFQIPPRQEILRHADSYGHIGAYRWPYQILEPEVTLPKNPESDLSIRKYTLTQDLSVPRSEIYKTVLGEIPGGELVDKAAVALLKSGYLRPSLLSIGWVSGKYELSKKRQIEAILKILRAKPLFLVTGIRAVLIKPLLVILKYIGWQISFVPSRNLRKHFNWFLTYGSSIGYFRLAFLSLKGKLRGLLSR